MVDIWLHYEVKLVEGTLATVRGKGPGNKRGINAVFVYD
jgi:hypothetical protein